MAISEIKMIIPCQCLLGEGPYFSRTFNCLLWVDILGGTLYRLDWTQKTLKTYLMPEPICWVMETTERRLIAGFERGIYYLDNSTLQPIELYPLPELAINNRLNDAKTDRNGYLFFGTMDKHEKRNTGALYRFGHQQVPTIVDNDYVISNGPAVSISGCTLYSTESSTKTIYQFDLDESGGISNKRVFAQFENGMGFPDGMTVDSEDHLWVAAWDGFGIYRYTPAGKKIQFINLPVPRITSVTFIGENLEYLAVTSARVGLDEEMIKAYPYSGAIFILDLKVKGVLETLAVL